MKSCFLLSYLPLPRAKRSYISGNFSHFYRYSIRPAMVCENGQTQIILTITCSVMLNKDRGGGVMTQDNVRWKRLSASACMSRMLKSAKGCVFSSGQSWCPFHDEIHRKLQTYPQMHVQPFVALIYSSVMLFHVGGYCVSNGFTAHWQNFKTPTHPPTHTYTQEANSHLYPNSIVSLTVSFRDRKCACQNSSSPGRKVHKHHQRN